MSTPAWRAPAPLIAQLLAQPQGFGFFQAVRLLDRCLASGPGGALAGGRLHFHSSMSMAFAASEIESLQAHWTSPDQVNLPGALLRVDLTPACMGLLGATGALPLFYTEWLAHAEHRRRDASPRAFLDLFGHRCLTLFYQAWRKHRLALHHEAEPQRAFLPHMLALAGLGLPGLGQRLASAHGGVPDEALARMASVLQQRTLGVVQLQRVLQHQLGVPVEITPFVGRWCELPRGALTVLGRAEVACLGRTAVLGERVWQRHLRMRITLGPMGPGTLRRFLPSGPGALALRQWLLLLQGTAIEHEVRLRLEARAVQPVALRASRAADQGRLGWDTFLCSRPSPIDRNDIAYDARIP